MPHCESSIMSQPIVPHSVRLPEDVLNQVKIRATVMHRSVNAELVYLLRKALDSSQHYDEEALRILRTSLERQRQMLQT